MKHATLHYIYDPMCGWCYATAPLLAAVRTIPNLNLVMHAGGMWTGVQAKHVTPQLRAFVLPNDKRIAQISGQPFGAAYLDGLLMDSEAILDSEPPIKAILAVEQLGFSGAEMLSKIQTAHFVKGLQVSRLETLHDIAYELGMDKAQFNAAYAQMEIQAHTRETRALMETHQVQGFPTLLLESEQGLERINHSAFYGRADVFGELLSAQLHSYG